MTRKKLWFLLCFLYVIFIVCVPWVPGFSISLGSIKLSLHRAGNITAALWFIGILLILLVPALRKTIFTRINKYDLFIEKYQHQIVWIIAFIICAVSCSYKLKAHVNFQTHTDDLGLFASVCWNTLHGDIMWNSLFGLNYCGIHCNLILIPLSFLFIIWNNAAVLLVTQAIVIGLSFPAVYYAARTFGLKPILSIFIGLLFFSHPKIIKLLAFDFHPDVFVILFYTWALLWWREKKLICFFLIMVCALLIKEDIPLTMAGFAMVIIITERNYWKNGMALYLISIIAFVGMVGCIIPYYNTGTEIANIDRYSMLGASWNEMFAAAQQHLWEFVRYYLQYRPIMPLITLFGAYGFLSFLSPIYLIPVGIGLLPHLLSQYEGQFMMSEIYVAASMPFLLYAMLNGLSMVMKKRGSSLFHSGVLIFVSLLIGINFMQSTKFYKYAHPARITAANAMIKLIDPSASMLAQSDILPHVVCRKNIQQFPKRKKINQMKNTPDYIAVEINGNCNPFTYQEWLQAYQGLQSDPSYALIYDKEGFQLWKKI